MKNCIFYISCVLFALVMLMVAFKSNDLRINDIKTWVELSLIVIPFAFCAFFKFNDFIRTILILFSVSIITSMVAAIDDLILFLFALVGAIIIVFYYLAKVVINPIWKEFVELTFSSFFTGGLAALIWNLLKLL